MTHVEESLESERTGISRRNVLRAGAVGAAVVGAGAAKVLMQPSLTTRGLMNPGRRLRRRVDRPGRRDLHRGVPDQPADPHPVHRSAADPAGGHAADAGRGRGTAAAARPGHRPAELVPQRDAPDLARTRSGSRTRSSTSSTCRSARTRSRRRRCCRSTRSASRRVVLRRDGQELPGRARCGRCRRARSTASTARSPGPMINAEYGKPVLVRFENHLDENPLNLDRQDFGSPDCSFLTHLHNGHTAPESDGNPHYSMLYGPQEPRATRQVVGRQPVPELAGRQRRPGEAELLLVPRPPHGPHRVERLQGHGRPLPDLRPEERPGHGRRDARACGCPACAPTTPTASFDVDYDIPLALYDCRLDDGVTIAPGHPRRRWASSRPRGNPRTHPEWWGKTFYKHFPNHGFVGDIFTVNGTAYPVLEVKRRKYRFRFLDASIAAHLRVQADELHPGPEDRGGPRLHRRRAAGPVPHPGRPAVHEVHPDRHRRRPAAVPDHPGLVRAVAGQAPRVHRRLHQVPGRLARPPRAT